MLSIHGVLPPCNQGVAAWQSLNATSGTCNDTLGVIPLLNHLDCHIDRIEFNLQASGASSLGAESSLESPIIKHGESVLARESGIVLIRKGRRSPLGDILELVPLATHGPFHLGSLAIDEDNAIQMSIAD